MERREELLKTLNNPTIAPLVDKLLFLEKQLDKLEKLPMIKIHPENPEIQKATPASKLYKEFLQQYTNVAKVICHATSDDSSEEESLLRKWVRRRLENDDAD